MKSNQTWVKKFLGHIKTPRWCPSLIGRKIDKKPNLISMWSVEQEHYDDIYMNHYDEIVRILKDVYNGTHNINAVYVAGSLCIGPLWDKYSSVSFNVGPNEYEINCPDEIKFWIAKCYIKIKGEQYALYDNAIKIVNQFQEIYDA